MSAQARHRSSVTRFGGGGHSMDVAGAMRGFETFAFNNAVRRYERTGEIDVSEDHTGTTDAGVALRSNYSFGDEAAVDQAWRIADGTDLLRVGGKLSDDGKGNHLGLTTIENGRRVVHLATLGKKGDIASQLAAGTTLQWEAHRDGRNNGVTGQWSETMHAAASSASMAARIAGSQRYGQQFSMSDQQIDILTAMVEGGNKGLAMHVAQNYDFTSGDNLRLMEDGSIQLDGDGWLKDREGNLLLDIHGNKIGAQDTEEGIAIVAELAGLALSAAQVSKLLAVTGSENGTVIGVESTTGTNQATIGAGLQDGLFGRLLDYQDDWAQVRSAAYGGLFQNTEQFGSAENNFARVMMLANLNDEIWQDGRVGYADYLDQNLVQTTIGGSTFWTHRNAANAMAGLSDQLTDRQLHDVFSTSVGSFVPRTVRGMNGALSTHALGLSIDFDPDNNPMFRLPATGERAEAHKRAIELFTAAASSHGGMDKTNSTGHIEAVKALQTAQRLGGIDGFVNEYRRVQNALNQMDVLSDQTLKMLDFVQSHAGLYKHLTTINSQSSSYGTTNLMINTGVVNHSPRVMDAFKSIGMPMLTWDTRPWGPWVGVDGMHFQLRDFGL